MDGDIFSNDILLEMAQEVLSLCGKVPLKSIIADLKITNSSELTINRVFDGKLLERLPPTSISTPTAFYSGNDTSLALSSDDEFGHDPFLNIISGNTKGKDIDRNGEASTSMKLEGSLKYNQLKDSPKDFQLKKEDFTPVSNKSKVAIDRVRDEVKYEVPPTIVPSYSKSILEGHTITKFEDSEPVIINSKSTPKKSAKKFKPMSQNTDELSDWDFELVSRNSGKQKQTVMITSPRSSSSIRDITPNSQESIPRLSQEGVSRPINKPIFVDLVDDSDDELGELANNPLIWASSQLSPDSKNTDLPDSSTRNELSIDRDLAPAESSDSKSATEKIEDNVNSYSWSDDFHWDSMIDVSLSPPRMDIDNGYNEEMDNIMEEMSGKSKKKLKRDSTSKLESSKSTKKVKKNSTSSSRSSPSLAAVDIQEWGADLDDLDSNLLSNGRQDEVISLEDEIAGRAKGRRRRVKSASDDDNDVKEPTKAELRKAEKGAQKEAQRESKKAEKLAKEAQKQAERQEKEEKRLAEKQAKEVEKQSKKAAQEREQAAKRELREIEQSRKREQTEREKAKKEEERKADIMAARERMINNRLTGKTDISKEMVLCLEESFYQSEFGEVLNDYLATIESQVDLLKVTSSSSSTGMSFSNDHLKAQNTIPLKHIMFWRRVISNRYDNNLDELVPLEKEYRETEPYLLFYVEAPEFAELIQQGKFKDLLNTARRDMKLRRNKERMMSSGQSSRPPALLKGDDKQQEQRVIVLIAGVESMLRGVRKAATERFRQAFLSRLQPASDGSSPIPFKATVEDVTSVDSERFEQEMIRLQLEENCFIIQTDDMDETAQALVSLTEQIGYSKYRDKFRFGLNVCIDGVKSGTDPMDTWIRTLQEIHMVTFTLAKSIAQVYPSIKKLYDGYQRCLTIYQAHAMLEYIPVIGKRAIVGKAISKRVYDVFMGEDPENVIS